MARGQVRGRGRGRGGDNSLEIYAPVSLTHRDLIFDVVVFGNSGGSFMKLYPGISKMTMSQQNSIGTILKLEFLLPQKLRKHGASYNRDGLFEIHSISCIGIPEVKKMTKEEFEILDHGLEIDDWDAFFLEIIVTYDFATATSENILTQGNQFQDFSAHIRGDQPLHIFVACPDVGLINIERGITNLVDGHTNNVNDQFHKSGVRFYQAGMMKNAHLIKETGKVYAARNTFSDRDHYNTHLGLAVELEHQAELNRAAAFTEMKHRLRIGEVLGCHDREYVVFLPLSMEDATCLTDGDTFKVILGEDAIPDWKALAWTVRVTHTLPYTPAGFITGYMKRPWDIGNYQAEISSQDNSNPSPLEGFQILHPAYQTLEDDTLHGCYRQLDLPVIPIKDLCAQRIISDAGISVLVQVDTTNQEYSTRLTAINDLQQVNLDDPLATEIESVLLANHVDDVPKHDIFKRVRKTLDKPDIRAIIRKHLNTAQCQAYFESAEQAPARMLLIQGPPGTGKSRTIIEMMVPYAFDEDKHQVLMLAPSNETTDNLAQRAHERLLELQATFPDNKKLQDCFVLRCHSFQTEDDAYRAQARAARPKSDAERPPDMEEVSDDYFSSINDDINIARMIWEHYKIEQSQKHSGVRDKRYKKHELSVGWRTLQAAGVIPGGPKASAVEQHLFLEGYDALSRGEEQTSEEIANFQAVAMSLRNWVLGNSTIVCTTVSNASRDIILENCHQVALIVFDEAARVQEPDTVAIITSQLGNDGFVLVGDPFQLYPVVTSSLEENPLRAQLSISLMNRLMAAGFPYRTLSEQHRLDPSISAIIENISYNGRLINHNSVINRPTAQKLREWNQKQYGHNSNFVFLDIQSQDAQTEVSNAESRYNIGFLKVASNLIVDLQKDFPECTIAYAPAYAAQHRLSLSMMENMKKSGVDTSNLRFQTVDSMQGIEYDIGVIDILLLEYKGIGFINDVHRLNMLFSRFKYGFYVLMNNKLFSGLKGRRWLAKFCSPVVKYARKIHTKNLTSEYVVDGQINLTQSKILGSM